MKDNNEVLAKIIDDKLKSEGLINPFEKQLAIKMAKGQLKDVDWKVALEEILNKSEVENSINHEAK